MGVALLAAVVLYVSHRGTEGTTAGQGQQTTQSSSVNKSSNTKMGTKEAQGSGQSGLDGTLLTAVSAYQAAYFSVRYDETPAERTARLKAYVTAGFQDPLLPPTTGLGPNQAQLALTTNQIVVSARVAKPNDVVLGQSSPDSATSTVTVTLVTTDKTGKSAVTQVLSTSHWVREGASWRVSSQDPTNGGDPG
jgi:hypothetical protein